MPVHVGEAEIAALEAVGEFFVIEAEEPDQLNELLSPDDYAELIEDEDH